MRRLSTLLVISALAGCGESGDPVDPGVDPEGVQVVADPADTSLFVGRSFPLRASLLDSTGALFPSDHFEYEALDAFVSVDSRGVVTGSAIGRARVVVRRGAIRDTVLVSVVPDGVIALNYVDVVDRLAVAGLDGAVSWTVPAGTSTSGPTTWLADGRVVVERHDYQLVPLLYVAGPDATITTFFPLPPVEDLVAERSPQATLDGEWIYYVSDHNIWRVHQDASGRERLTAYEDPVEVTSPVPSPDGTKLIYIWNRVDGTPIRHIVRDIATGAEQTIEGIGGNAHWSPDGQWLAYWKAFNGADREAVYVSRADGSEERRVTAEGRRLYDAECIEWSPDGRWLVLCRGNLELVDVTDGTLLPLAWATQGRSPSWRR